ncbi:hypothetical protein RV13_GL001222 [Enterococcus raffinosus]|nr:hypothetical protein RV13_GL001222 [Enterococcus raffinosus]
MLFIFVCLHFGEKADLFYRVNFIFGWSRGLFAVVFFLFQ